MMGFSKFVFYILQDKLQRTLIQVRRQLCSGSEMRKLERDPLLMWCGVKFRSGRMHRVHILPGIILTALFFIFSVFLMVGYKKANLRSP